jgi:hypothetical protein
MSDKGIQLVSHTRWRPVMSLLHDSDLKPCYIVFAVDVTLERPRPLSLENSTLVLSLTKASS